MAARAPAAIGGLTDDLLARVFAALPDPGIIFEDRPMRDRCALPQVCRRWRAVAASPAAAPVWARSAVRLGAGPAADPARFSSLVGWFAGRGKHVRALALRNESYRAPRAWETVRAVVALAPGVEELTIWCSSPPPGGLEWWHSLPLGLTRLVLRGFEGGEAGARAALPPALLELRLDTLDQHPPTLAGLTRLTRLEIEVIDASEEEAASDDFLEELGGLRALRHLALRCDVLERVPAAVGALAALTHLDVGACAMSAPGALDPLASLPRLESLRLSLDELRTPSALTGLTSLRELSLVPYGAFEGAEAPMVEPGPYLAALRVLKFDVQNVCADLVDVPRRVVEPLRAATALTELAFDGSPHPRARTASRLLLTADRVEALLAGKPALRRVHVAQQMRLKEEDEHFAALGRRHPQIDFSLPASSDDGWWYR